MITLQTLTDHKKEHKDIGVFLKDKCRDYLLAKNDTHYHGMNWGIAPEGRFSDYFVEDNTVVVYFKDMFHRDGEKYELPHDILFDNDFYELIKERFEKDEIKSQKENEERKKRADLQLLDELQKKYKR